MHAPSAVAAPAESIVTRRLRYQVAVSLDGFIARPNGEYDWIVADPSIDFAALYAEFDTAVMGRKTYEVAAAQGGDAVMPGIDVIVFSSTLPATSRPGVRIVDDDPREVVEALKAKPGRDIWLFGGGALFRSLLDAGLVDTVEVAVMPVLLGAGIPLLPPGASAKLVLADQKTLPASGIVVLAYSVQGGAGPAPRIRYVKPAKRGGKTGSRAASSTRRAAKKRATKKPPQRRS
jgi:dihydrofolate reductase